METVGYLATILAAILVIGLITLGAISVPDVRRYLRIRNM
jgi:hypothetical protein